MIVALDSFFTYLSPSQQLNPAYIEAAAGVLNPGMALGSIDVSMAVQRFIDECFKHMSDLQSVIPDDTDWPIRKDVKGIVLKRENVSKITYPWWGALTIDLPNKRPF